MSKPQDEEDDRLRSAALQNAQSILVARQKAEDELVRAKKALESRTAELTLSNAMLKATLESTTDGILVTDNQGHVTDFNDAFLRMWKIAREDVEGRSHSDIEALVAIRLVEKHRKAFQDRVSTIYDEAPPEAFDVIELADGRVFERFSRLQIVDGHKLGRVWSLRDLTERRRSEREHAYLAAIVSSSTDAIIAKTLQGVVTSWNAAAVRMFGYTADEAVGQPITALIIPPDRVHEETTFLELLRKGEAIQHFETVRHTKDGRHLVVSLTISPVKDRAGRIIGASKIARDVTEREGLLARERAARAEAEEASRLKDEFLATASHELRTPLNAILGWAQILRMGHLDEDKARHAAEVVERNARAQAQVINDLMDVSRIITGKLRLDMRPLMPALAIESALDSVRPAADAKGVDLRVALDPEAGPVSGDPSRLQQIVWNLLSNAIKFTPRGGCVEISLTRLLAYVEITVTDTGEGITSEFLPHVFDRFRQADASASRQKGGLGLGLAIVRHLVELHSGMVAAESPGKGKGAIFTVRLPLSAARVLDDKESESPAAAASGRAFAGGPDLSGVRVLVVDDERDARDIMREMLEGCGAVVRDAPSAVRALEVVKEWRPAVIVSDIGMPGEDGYVLIRQVREWERSAGTWIPAIALTAYARSEDRVRALVAGYQVHIAKPIDPLELALVVAGVLKPGTSGSGRT